MSIVVDRGGVNVSERRRGQHDESLDESVDDTEGMSLMVLIIMML